MPERVTEEDLELLEELGVDAAPAATGGRTAREQRILAGFEEIERFVEEHGRPPEHGEGRDIFERLYAVRLDRLRESAECRGVLKGMDPRGLLGAGNAADASQGNEEPEDEDLLASLGVGASAENDVTQLVHVRSRDEIKAAEEVAQRNPCKDFETFKPMFEKVQRELATGVRQTTKYKHDADVGKGDLFILDGQKVLVAEAGEQFVSDYGRPDRRLRVVYDNGTESDLLARSLQRALYKDKASRRIVVESSLTPLFSDECEEGDLASGYIYVLRSKSEHPFVAKNRTILHKIGLTEGDVKSRIANAKKEPTYLLADVEVVATYKLSNVSCKALESLLHKVFGAVRLDLELKDRFNFPVAPREWFLVPLPVIDEAIQKIKDETIGAFRYDPEKARLISA